jgi:uncharacterized protein with von Willebrand factor type A (vWA) domain
VTTKVEGSTLRALVGFARTLRAAGVDAGPDRLHAMVGALDQLDVARPGDVYWAGRLTLCAGPDDISRYDRAFSAWFGGEMAPAMRPGPPPIEVVKPVAVPASGVEGELDGDVDPRTATASAIEVLRHRDLAKLQGDERAQVARLIAAIDPLGPVRRARRMHPSPRGPLDPRRTVRSMLRRAGEPVRLEHRTRRERPRRVVLLVDVSGSMQPYADGLLRFAYAMARHRPGTEVFTLGTRLTRVTRPARLPDADAALTGMAAQIPDWSGGTRLGEMVKLFLDRWGQRGVARGAVVVVASDGWERGDATLLGEQMARLHRLAHRVVWVNPHAGKEGFAPQTAGMQAALPYVDSFVAGHSLGALERLARVVAGGEDSDA